MGQRGRKKGCTLDEVTKGGLFEEVVCGQRFESIWAKKVPGRRNSKCQGSKARRSSVWVRMSISDKFIFCSFLGSRCCLRCLGIYTSEQNNFLPYDIYIVRLGRWMVFEWGGRGRQ